MSTPEQNTGSQPVADETVAGAIKLAGDVARVSKDAIISGSVILGSTDDERASLQAYVTRCEQQGAAINAIKAANKANRPPSRQRVRKPAAADAAKGSKK